jgi:hypothetical protein
MGKKLDLKMGRKGKKVEEWNDYKREYILDLLAG